MKLPPVFPAFHSLPKSLGSDRVWFSRWSIIELARDLEHAHTKVLVRPGAQAECGLSRDQRTAVVQQRDQQRHQPWIPSLAQMRQCQHAGGRISITQLLC